MADVSPPVLRRTLSPQAVAPGRRARCANPQAGDPLPHVLSDAAKARQQGKLSQRLRRFGYDGAMADDLAGRAWTAMVGPMPLDLHDLGGARTIAHRRPVTRRSGVSLAKAPLLPKGMPPPANDDEA